MCFELISSTIKALKHLFLVFSNRVKSDYLEFCSDITTPCGKMEISKILNFVYSFLVINI